MKARFATQKEIADWNSLILKNPDGGNIFASYQYSQQKIMTGYKPVFIMVGKIAVTVLEKNTFPTGKLWYMPKGPELTDATQLIECIGEIKKLAMENNVFLIKIEPEINNDQKNILKNEGYLKSSAIIPNASTIKLDTSASPESILMSLPQKGRHAIRRAERDGVSVKRVDSSSENCKILYKLLEETARGQFGIRSYDYFEKFWKKFHNQDMGQMFFAYFDGKVVAGAYAMTFGQKSTYKDGASIRKRTAYGASHLLQWNVILWAKEKGSNEHDFCGSPPSDQINNTEHPHYGVGRFKLSFSKNIIDYIGCYDVVISPRKYKLWKKFLERLHRGLYYRIKKDYYY